MFESSVNSDGTQTDSVVQSTVAKFESSVNSDGTQTRIDIDKEIKGLRVV